MKLIKVYREGRFFEELELAQTSPELKKGLLGRTTAGTGMFLMGARRIHTYKMKFSIDVVYINQNGFIIGLQESLAPHQMGSHYEDTAHIVEFNAGTIEKNNIRVGEEWRWTLA